ncbi:hypothetical protein BLOT_016215 [Blomia tropicalis]|nr:hypothetical protein BLOT_016215 [Blomia tropicalis]
MALLVALFPVPVPTVPLLKNSKPAELRFAGIIDEPKNLLTKNRLSSNNKTLKANFEFNELL